MKITIDIECSPEEARQFFGFPEVQKLQQAAMAAVQERMTEQVKSMDPEALMKAWLPTGIQGWEDVRKAFMQGFTSGAGKAPDQP
jgi:hypothetical protein